MRGPLALGSFWRVCRGGNRFVLVIFAVFKLWEFTRSGITASSFVEVERYAIAILVRKDGNSMGLILDARGSTFTLWICLGGLLLRCSCASAFHAFARSNVPDSFNTNRSYMMMKRYRVKH